MPNSVCGLSPWFRLPCQVEAEQPLSALAAAVSSVAPSPGPRKRPHTRAEQAPSRLAARDIARALMPDAGDASGSGAQDPSRAAGVPEDDADTAAAAGSEAHRAGLLQNVLRAALFQLNEADFQAGRGAGELPTSEPRDSPSLVVLSVVRRAQEEAARGALSFATAAAPLEFVLAELYRTSRTGATSLVRLYDTLHGVLSRLRAKWTGLHPLSGSARRAVLALLQPLAEVDEAVRLLRGGSTASAVTLAGGAGMPPHLLQGLRGLVGAWEMRGLGVAGQGGPSGGHPTANGSALQSAMRTRQLLLLACSSPAALAHAAGSGAVASVVQSVQRTAREAAQAARFAAAEAALTAGCFDVAQETLPSYITELAAAEAAAEAMAAAAAAATTRSDAAAAAASAATATANRHLLRLFASHVRTCTAQVAATPDDPQPYRVLLHVLDAMRSWHRTATAAVQPGQPFAVQGLDEQGAAVSKMVQSEALLALARG